MAQIKQIFLMLDVAPIHAFKDAGHRWQGKFVGMILLYEIVVRETIHPSLETSLFYFRLFDT